MYKRRGRKISGQGKRKGEPAKLDAREKREREREARGKRRQRTRQREKERERRGGGNEARIESDPAREKLIRAFKEPRGVFNSVPHSTTKWSPASPKRGNQSSLCAPSLAFRLCAYITFDPHLRRALRHPSRAAPAVAGAVTTDPPLSPRPSVRPRSRRPTCSAPAPFPELIRQTSDAAYSQPTAALRNFISRRANYTPRFHARETVVISVGQLATARRASRVSRARLLV